MPAFYVAFAAICYPVLADIEALLNRLPTLYRKLTE